MTRPLLLIWLFGLSAIASGVVAAFDLAFAVATASMRFGECGPTDLEASEGYCRVGAQLLYLSYAGGALSLVLCFITLRLLRRRGTGPNNSFNPKLLRNSS